MTAQPQRTIPPDLSMEQFLSASDVQTTPIARSQFGTVLGAYDRTIGNTRLTAGVLGHFITVNGGYKRCLIHEWPVIVVIDSVVNGFVLVYNLYRTTILKCFLELCNEPTG